MSMMPIPLFPQWKNNVIREVSIDGLDLEKQSEEARSDADIVKAAVNQNGIAIRSAPSFQQNFAMAEIAVRSNGLAWFYLSHDLRKNEQLTDIAKTKVPSSYAGKGVNLSKRCIFVVGSKIESLALSKYSPDTKAVHLEKSLISTEFLRDALVSLPSGEQLIPFPISSRSQQLELHALLPQRLKHHVRQEDFPCGKGFEKDNVLQAMINCYHYRLPFRQAKTCIEGGNCFLFKSNGKQMALIGEISLYLSMLALIEQGFLAPIDPSQGAASKSSLRAARNLDLLQRLKKDKTKVLEEKYREYFRTLKQPLSKEEEETFAEEGRKIDAFLAFTKRMMAEDLKIPLENIVFIPQRVYHIDMELFVTPDGRVVLHDDGLSVKFLEKTKKVGASFFLEQAKKNAALFKGIHALQRQALKAKKIKQMSLPLSFECLERSSALNHSNGIFVELNESRRSLPFYKDVSPLKKYAFVSTGPSFKWEKDTHSRLRKLFEKKLPEILFVGVENMSRFLSKNEGGIRCLTFETFSSTLC